MKKWFSWILCFFLGILCTVAVKKITKRKHQKPQVIALNIAQKPGVITSNKNFVILVPSYNNAKYYKKNLESIISQTYPFYRVLYFDDCSTDETFEKVSKWIESNGCQEKMTLIHNQQNQGALYNIYSGVNQCKDDEIVVILDGDDAFASDRVLETLNAYYNDPNVWLTYGQFINYPDYEVGFNVPIPIEELKSAKLRFMTWRTSHLRTFYAALFKKIHVEDLQYQGHFLETTYDVAMMLPMLEMAREHAFFTPDILYIYNDENPISDSKVKREKQLFYDRYIRSKPIYSRVENLFMRGKETV